MFLINCGANLHLEDYLSLADYDRLLLCVVDSHRPLDLFNIQEKEDDSPFEVRAAAPPLAPRWPTPVATAAGTHAHAICCGKTQIFVVDAGDEDEQASRPDLSVLEDISDQSDSSGSSSDSDDLDSDSEDEEERMRKRRSVGEDGESHEVDDEEDESSRRRRRRRQKRKQKELNEQIQEYYSVTYYGATAASYMFKLASQLNHKDNKLLWLNIVAVTDYYVFERYTGEQYHDKVELLQHEVGRLNMQPEEDDRSGAPEQDRIAFTEEFRFMVRLPHPRSP